VQVGSVVAAGGLATDSLAAESVAIERLAGVWGMGARACASRASLGLALPLPLHNRTQRLADRVIPGTGGQLVNLHRSLRLGGLIQFLDHGANQIE
jgi:hypothetical protein